MFIDNFHILLPIINFFNAYDFWYIEIIHIDPNNKDFSENRVITHYCIESKNEYLDIEDELKDLCEVTNSHAVLYSSLRNYKDVALNILKRSADLILEGTYKDSEVLFRDACRSQNLKDSGAWIMDFKHVQLSQENINTLVRRLKVVPPPNTMKVIKRVPHRTGEHILVNQYDYTKLIIKGIPKFTLRQNGFVNIYIPDEAN